MYQDGARKPATLATVDAWIAKYHCPYDVVVEPSTRPGILPSTGGTIGLPYHLVINPRDMTVYAVVQGGGTTLDAKVEALIAANGG